MKKTFFIFIVLFLLVACSQPTPDSDAIETAIAQTEAANPTNTNPPEPSNTPEPTETNTPEPTNTPKPTNTPRPTNTKSPTNTPTQPPTSTPVDTTQIISKNYVASQDSGGVILEVARVLIANKDAVDIDFSDEELFDDKLVVMEIIFRLVNNTDETIEINIHRGLIAVNSEQVQLNDYWLNTDFGDDFYEDQLPGVTAIGGYWVGLKRTAVEDVTKILIRIDHPTDTDYNRLGPEYIFEIDVEDWGWEELPEELN